MEIKLTAIWLFFRLNRDRETLAIHTYSKIIMEVYVTIKFYKGFQIFIVIIKVVVPFNEMVEITGVLQIVKICCQARDVSVLCGTLSFIILKCEIFAI